MEEGLLQAYWQSRKFLQQLQHCLSQMTHSCILVIQFILSDHIFKLDLEVTISVNMSKGCLGCQLFTLASVKWIFGDVVRYFSFVDFKNILIFMKNFFRSNGKNVCHLGLITEFHYLLQLSRLHKINSLHLKMGV